MAKQTQRRYWGISLGEGGRYVSQARHGNYIGIGWNELGDLTPWAERLYEGDDKLRDELRSVYRKVFPEETAVQSGIQAGQVASFVFGMRPGDIALVRDPVVKRVHVTEVIGSYLYVEKPEDGCPYRHRREVRWTPEEINRSELPEALKTSLYSQLTVFNLDKRRDEIEWLLGGSKPADSGGLVQVVRKRLMGLAPHEFQRLVGEILGLAGFSVVVNEIGPDGGVDVIGTFDAGNLAEITLCVQVKRITGSTGIKDILALRGTLKERDQGAFITLGSFTKQARQEAEAPGKNKVRAIDGEEFIDLILERYDELPMEYKNLLSLQRVKTPLREQFTIAPQAGAKP